MLLVQNSEKPECTNILALWANYYRYVIDTVGELHALLIYCTYVSGVYLSSTYHPPVLSGNEYYKYVCMTK